MVTIPNAVKFYEDAANKVVKKMDSRLLLCLEENIFSVGFFVLICRTLKVRKGWSGRLIYFFFGHYFDR